MMGEIRRPLLWTTSRGMSRGYHRRGGPTTGRVMHYAKSGVIECEDQEVMQGRGRHTDFIVYVLRHAS